MIGVRAIRNGLRAPALRTAALSRPSVFPNYVRHNSDKVKGVVIGIGNFPEL